MDDVKCAAHLLEFDENTALPLDKFFGIYRNHFPMLAVIVDGHYGETIFDCFENYQVIRIHCYSSQPRVICTDRSSARAFSQNFYSIPVKNNYGFQKVKGHTSVGEVQSLDEILAENELPVLVKLALEPHRLVKMISWSKTAGDIGNLLIKAKYEEHYMMVNCIDTKELKMNSTCCLMGLSKQLTATPVIGFKKFYKSEDEYQAYLRQLHHQVVTSGEMYNKSRGNPVFAMYENDQELPSALKRILEDLRQSEASKDGGDSDYEEVLEPAPVVPPRGQNKEASCPAGPSSPTDSKYIPKQHKTGKFSGLISRFHKQKSGDKSENKESGGRKHSAEDNRKVDTSDAKPVVYRKPDAVKTDSSDAPPRIPRHPSAEEEKSDTDAVPPLIQRKPIATEGKVKAVGTKRSDAGYANKALPNAVVKPMKSSPAPPLVDERKPQPLPKGMPGMEEIYGGVYSEVFEYQQTYPEEGPDEIYSTGDEEGATEEYFKIQSGDRSLRIKDNRMSEDMSSKRRRPADKQLADTEPEAANPPERARAANDKVAESTKAGANEARKESDTFDITTLSISDVSEALSVLRLDKYAEEFKDNQIDGEILSQLSVDDLVQELNMKKLEAVRLSRYIESGHVPK